MQISTTTHGQTGAHDACGPRAPHAARPPAPPTASTPPPQLMVHSSACPPSHQRSVIVGGGPALHAHVAGTPCTAPPGVVLIDIDALALHTQLLVAAAPPATTTPDRVLQRMLALVAAIVTRVTDLLPSGADDAPGNEGADAPSRAAPATTTPTNVLGLQPPPPPQSDELGIDLRDSGDHSDSGPLLPSSWVPVPGPGSARQGSEGVGLGKERVDTWRAAWRDLGVARWVLLALMLLAPALVALIALLGS